MRFSLNASDGLHHLLNGILLLIVGSSTDLLNLGIGLLVNLTKALIWLSRVLTRELSKRNTQIASWNISSFTCATKSWYSAFFCALSSSISLAASERASFKRWTRSTCGQSKSQCCCYMAQNLHCLAFWTILEASRSASKRVLIPWELEVDYTWYPNVSICCALLSAFESANVYTCSRLAATFTMMFVTINLNKKRRGKKSRCFARWSSRRGEIETRNVSNEE